MNRKIKLFLVMFLAFGIVHFSNGTIFLAGTPRIRPNLPQYLALKAKSFSEPLQQKYLSFMQSLKYKNNDTASTIPSKSGNSEVFFKPVSKGVYAEEDQKTGEIKSIEMRLDEVQWKEQSIEINGKKCSINFPEGVTLPENVLRDICQK